MRNEMKAVTQNKLMIYVGVSLLKGGAKPFTEKSICRKETSLEIQDFAEC